MCANVDLAPSIFCSNHIEMLCIGSHKVPVVQTIYAEVVLFQQGNDDDHTDRANTEPILRTDSRRDETYWLASLHR